MEFKEEPRRCLPAACFLVMLTSAAPPLFGSFHTWRINEVFSNRDGTVQYIEMRESQGFGGQHQLSIPSVDSTTNANSFFFPNNLDPLISTIDNFFLMATEGFRQLPGAPEPDYIIPANFFSPNGDTLDFDGISVFTFDPGDLPLDGIHALQTDFSTALNTPTAFSVDREPGFVVVPLSDPLPDEIEKGEIAIELELVADGLTAPLVLTHAGDTAGRLFIAEQTGLIWIYHEGGILPAPFLDLSDRLVPLGFFGTMDESDFDERGLLGLAFHPDYHDPNRAGYGKFYTYSSEPNDIPADFPIAMPPGAHLDHQSIVTEWCVDPNNPDRADPNSRRELLRIDQPQFNHNAGALAFGPDDYLYIALGDGGGANDRDFDTSETGHGPTGNGQNTETLLGSIIRIDPLRPGDTPGSTNPVSGNGAYRIPADNPFVGQAGADEIFAYGLRNPYRFSFDRASGNLILGDVGQDYIEEVNVVQAGGNYGWNRMEGSFDFDPNSGSVTTPIAPTPQTIDPNLQYDHDEGLSVIGGFVYHGCEIRGLSGHYVFGDFSRDFGTPEGRLFYADVAAGLIHEFTLGLDDRDLGLYVKSFGQDAGGEIYLLAGTNLGPFGTGSQVYRIVTADEAPASRISRVDIRASRDRSDPSDTIKVSGFFSCELPATGSVAISVTDQTTAYGIDLDLPDLAVDEIASGRLRVKGTPPGLQSLLLDFNKGTFAIDARQLDLTGLASPVLVHLTVGVSNLLLTADESLINRAKPIPICLLTGVADTLRIDKALVRSTTRGDSLKVLGGVAAADGDADLTTEPLTIHWGNYAETLDPNGLSVKSPQRFIYRKPKTGSGAVTKVDIDLGRCRFLVQLKNAPPLEAQGNVTLRIVSDAFHAEDVHAF